MYAQGRFPLLSRREQHQAPVLPHPTPFGSTLPARAQPANPVHYVELKKCCPASLACVRPCFFPQNSDGEPRVVGRRCGDPLGDDPEQAGGGESGGAGGGKQALNWVEC